MLAIQTQTTATRNLKSGVATAPKLKRAAPEVVQLNRVNLKDLIVKQDGLFVAVDYIKADGTARTLTGRLGVQAYLKGGTNNVMADERPYLTMFDIQLCQYRTVNLASVSEMRASRKVYRVID